MKQNHNMNIILILLLIRLVEKVLPTLSGTWSLSTWGRSRTRARRRGQWAMMRMGWGQCPRCRSPTLSWPVSMVINSPCLNSWIKVRGLFWTEIWNITPTLLVSKNGEMMSKVFQQEKSDGKLGHKPHVEKMTQVWLWWLRSSIISWYFRLIFPN